MHPYLTQQFAEEHRRDLLRVAEQQRLTRGSKAGQRWWARQQLARPWRFAHRGIWKSHIASDISPSRVEPAVGRC